MDSEERRHAYGGTDRAGGTTERPSGSHGQDSLTIGELARDSGVTLKALRFYQSKGLLASTVRPACSAPKTEIVWR